MTEATLERETTEARPNANAPQLKVEQGLPSVPDVQRLLAGIPTGKPVRLDCSKFSDYPQDLFYIRPLSAAAYDQYTSEPVRMTKSGKFDYKGDTRTLSLVQKTLCLADGQLVYPKPEDIAKIGKLDSRFVAHAAKTAREVCGLTEADDDEDEELKNDRSER